MAPKAKPKAKKVRGGPCGHGQTGAAPRPLWTDGLLCGAATASRPRPGLTRGLPLRGLAAQEKKKDGVQTGDVEGASLEELNQKIITLEKEKNKEEEYRNYMQLERVRAEWCGTGPCRAGRAGRACGGTQCTTRPNRLARTPGWTCGGRAFGQVTRGLDVGGGALGLATGRGC